MSAPSSPNRQVITGTFFKEHKARVEFTEKRRPARPPARRPAKVAQMLALAHHLQRAIDAGRLVDRASCARQLGFSRARLTYLFDLLLLAPDLQEQVLAMEAVEGREPLTERRLREVVGTWDWQEQRRWWPVKRDEEEGAAGD